MRSSNLAVGPATVDIVRLSPSFDRVASRRARIPLGLAPDPELAPSEYPFHLKIGNR